MVDEQEKKYYNKKVKNGCDYNIYGNWQKQYARLVVFTTSIFSWDIQKTILDIGCACGANLVGFRETKVFTKHIGIDQNKFMLQLGRDQFGFNDTELISDDATKLDHIPHDSVHLVHCSHLFEELTEDQIDETLLRIKAVLVTGGIAWIVFSKKYNSVKDVLRGNVEPEVTFFKKIIQKHQFELMAGHEMKFAKATFYPDDNLMNFYDQYHNDWRVFVLIKVR